MQIELKKISKTFDTDGVKTPVLFDVSFNIDRGEFIAIMGPSGSGKSTLMHIIGLLDFATRGGYKLDSLNIDNFDDNELARLRNQKFGFVFQSFHLLPRTTVLENVKLPLTYSKEENDSSALARDALKSVGLTHRLNYLTNQISGGEKQRVAIARALVNNPDIILADEPTGNLDSKSGMQVMKILQNLNDQGKTIILVTHEFYTAEHSKRIIKMMDGKLKTDTKVRNRRRASSNGKLK
ncbi:ABC transporter ATP-binding protein [Patescibacteria group bacterium]|nr:ABC transporter ATP-binding protein [Patescibacteria group bacterium]